MVILLLLVALCVCYEPPENPQVIEVTEFILGLHIWNPVYVGRSPVSVPAIQVVNRLVEKGFVLKEHYLVTANFHKCYCWVLESDKWYPLGWVDESVGFKTWTK